MIAHALTKFQRHTLQLRRYSGHRLLHGEILLPENVKAQRAVTEPLPQTLRSGHYPSL